MVDCSCFFLYGVSLLLPGKLVSSSLKFYYGKYILSKIEGAGGKKLLVFIPWLK